ncbi:hypothetical protein ACFLY7_02320, partial [Patescibacteria group bacterium]
MKKAKKSKNILSIIKTISLIFILSTSIVHAAWIAPTEAPPDGNTSAPVRADSSSQIKTGDLTISNLLSAVGGLFSSDVSIGLANPFSLLHIQGKAWITASGTASCSGSAITVSIADEIGVGYQYQSSSHTGIITNRNNSTVFTIDTACSPTYSSQSFDYKKPLLRLDNNSGTNKFILTPDGKLGLSEAGPEYNLDLGSSATIRIQNGASNGRILTSDAGGVATWQSAPSGADDMGDHIADQNIRLNGNWLSNDGESEGVFVDIAGNVGIGVTDPDTKLEVAGQVKITGGTPGSGQVLTSDANGLATWETPSSGADDLGDHTASENIQLDGNWLSNDGESEGVFVDIAGNVGIGVTDPDTKLEVAGQVKITGGTPGSGQVLTSDANGLATWETPSSGADDLGDHTASENIQLDGNWLSNDGGSEGVFVATDGDVGIGTNAPNTKLDVNGTIQSKLTDSYDKIRIYPSASYTIGMKSAQTLGFLNDWATTFTMNNDTDRGWLWRDTADTSSDGAMSLTTDGKLYVKNTASFNEDVGIGTVSPTQKLDVVGFINTDSGYKQNGETILKTSESNSNTLTGYQAGNVTTGDNNVANGSRALYNNGSGYSNITNGYEAMFSNTSGYG